MPFFKRNFIEKLCFLQSFYAPHDPSSHCLNSNYIITRFHLIFHMFLVKIVVHQNDSGLRTPACRSAPCVILIPNKTRQSLRPELCDTAFRRRKLRIVSLLTPCGDTKNAAGLRFPLHFSSSPLLSSSQTAELGTSHASRASGFPPLGESSAAERQPCLPLPPAAAGLPSVFLSNPNPLTPGFELGGTGAAAAP